MPAGLFCILASVSLSLFFFFVHAARGPQGRPLITFDQGTQLIEPLQETSGGERGNQGRPKKMETRSCSGNSGGETGFFFCFNTLKTHQSQGGCGAEPNGYFQANMRFISSEPIESPV